MSARPRSAVAAPPTAVCCDRTTGAGPAPFRPQRRHSRARAHRWLPSAAIALLVVAAPARAHDGGCAAIDDDVQRLACYDRAAGRAVPAAAARAAAPAAARTGPPIGAQPVPPRGEPLPQQPSFADASALSKAWELDARDKRGTFNLLPHKLNYALPALYTSNPNTLPQSPAADHRLGAPLPLQRIEGKYQLSLKVKAFENLFGNNGDLWLAYTQQSFWQLYNSRFSSPFRTTDYEPEAILSLRTPFRALGVDWKMLNFGAVHQSNGSGGAQSRSWNRLYAQFGFERGPWSLTLRPWWRLPESAGNDDNPDIRRYLGSGDARLTYLSGGGSVYSALGRYAGPGRGYLQLDWAFPLSKALKGYVQATTGYGASLIDYNHSQTTIGAGLLLLPWQ